MQAGMVRGLNRGAQFSIVIMDQKVDVLTTCGR